jgi:transposase-like protein
MKTKTVKAKPVVCGNCGSKRMVFRFAFKTHLSYLCEDCGDYTHV